MNIFLLCDVWTVFKNTSCLKQNFFLARIFATVDDGHDGHDMNSYMRNYMYCRIYDCPLGKWWEKESQLFKMGELCFVGEKARKTFSAFGAVWWIIAISLHELYMYCERNIWLVETVNLKIFRNLSIILVDSIVPSSNSLKRSFTWFSNFLSNYVQSLEFFVIIHITSFVHGLLFSASLLCPLWVNESLVSLFLNNVKLYELMSSLWISIWIEQKES